jgi:hypothetical protein
VSEVNGGRVAGLCYIAGFATLLVCVTRVTLLCVTVTSHVSHPSLPGISQMRRYVGLAEYDYYDTHRSDLIM